LLCSLKLKVFAETLLKEEVSHTIVDFKNDHMASLLLCSLKLKVFAETLLKEDVSHTIVDVLELILGHQLFCSACYNLYNDQHQLYFRLPRMPDSHQQRQSIAETESKLSLAYGNNSGSDRWL
jgi:hypothetical protein